MFEPLKVFQHYLRKAGIIKSDENIPFHALRATCIKRAQKRGWSITQVAKLVDDKVLTIQMHYETPSKAEMRNVANDKPL